MERKVDGVSLTVIPSKWAPAAAVTVSFPAPDLNWFVLQKLLPERPCGCATLAAGSEYTALVYAMYDNVRDMLIGTPDKQMKSKVASITCGYQNGEFIISYVCQGSITAVRKSLGICISRLAPQKMYQRYSKYIKLLGGKPKRAEFLNCANRVAASRHVCVVVVAKINTDKGKEEAMLKTVSKKLPDVSGIDRGTKPASESATRGVTEYPEVKVDDYNIFFVQDFLDASNILALPTGSTIIVYDKRWRGPKAGAIEKYVTARFGKLDDKIMPVVVYSACSRGMLRCRALCDLARANVSPKDIVAAIKSALK
jgi:hypothetical protein